MDFSYLYLLQPVLAQILLLLQVGIHLLVIYFHILEVVLELQVLVFPNRLDSIDYVHKERLLFIFEEPFPLRLINLFVIAVEVHG